MHRFDTFDLSNLDKNFYKFDRERFLANTPLHKRLSSNTIKYSNIDSSEELINIGVKYLLKFSHSIFKYVTNETNLVISFTFKSNSSYCDLVSNKIVIDTNILKNEELPYQLRIDALQGVIFHEFLHKRITIADISKFLEIPLNEYYHSDNTHLLTKFLESYIDSNIKRHIWNILEDYRIERFGIRDFPGFGFFLDEARKYAYYHLSNRAIKNGQPFGFYAIDYLMITILMPELREDTINKVNDLFPNGEYQKFVDEIDKCIKKYYDYVYGNTFEEIKVGVEQLNKIFEKHKVNSNDLEAIPSFNKGNPFAFNQPSGWNKEGKITKAEKDELEDFLEELIKEFTSNIDKKTGGNNNLICITEKVEQTIHAPEVNEIKIFKQPIAAVNTQFLKEAKKMAQSICTNLGFLSARLNKNNNDYELSEGEIDESELYSISYKKNIFYNENTVKGYELDLGILLDESASMYENINEVIIACLALIISFQNDKHINLSVYGHTADHDYDDSGSRDICLFKYYDTRENFKNMNTVFGVESRSNNADGFAIEKMCEIMSRSKNKEKVLIVISDGSPHASCYSGIERGVKHTRDVIKKYEAKGFFIIQICMARIENSSSMFTHFIPFEKNKKFSNNLKNVLKKKLIQLHNQV